MMILSNGVMQSDSPASPWIDVGANENNQLIVAGSRLTSTTAGSATATHIREEATLEISDGEFGLYGYNNQLRLYSNSTFRVIGPKATISIGFFVKDKERFATTELILTKDLGHISRMRHTDLLGGQRDAPQTPLEVGLQGGACMLATNVIPYVWAVRPFYSTNSYSPTLVFDLDMWDVTETVNPPPELDGYQKEITLKSAAFCGSVALPSDTIAVADKAYGYIDVSDMSSGSILELSVYFDLTEVDGTIDQIVTDLQTAGYPNTTRSGNTVEMVIAAADLPPDSGHFAWDFREFDGSTNATVSSVTFSYVLPGTVIMVN